MATLYNFPTGHERSELVEQPFSLYQLMQGIPNHPDNRTREGDCYVKGIRFVPKGSEFDELIEVERQKLAGLDFSSEEVEEMLAPVIAKDKLTAYTDFAAVAHPRYWNERLKCFLSLDGLPYDGFITDFKHLAIVRKQEKRLVIVPYDEHGHHRLLFYDVLGSKMADRRWDYDGGMADALTEFSHDYAFDIARNPIDMREELDIRRQYGRDHSVNYIVLRENVSLDDVVNLIKQ